MPSEIKPRPPDHTHQTTSIVTTSDSVAAVARLPVLATGSDTQSGRETSEQRKEEDEEAGGGEREEEADEGEEWPKFISSEELARNRLSKQGQPVTALPHLSISISLFPPPPPPPHRDAGCGCVPQLLGWRAISETVH